MLSDQVVRVIGDQAVLSWYLSPGARERGAGAASGASGEPRGVADRGVGERCGLLRGARALRKSCVARRGVEGGGGSRVVETVESRYGEKIGGCLWMVVI